MDLRDKMIELRKTEGARRGLDRPMSQSEVSRLMQRELGAKVSQAYLSQIERGVRRHLTADSRALLAKFFGVHPGYLVDDPKGYTPAPFSDPERSEKTLDEWLRSGAELFGDDGELSDALTVLSHHPDSRRCLVLAAEMFRAAGAPLATARPKRRTRRS
ncbi:MAG TPA: helix-turn-helix transcriptional regulator [Thermoanaerobaculia bacterium]